MIAGCRCVRGSSYHNRLFDSEIFAVKRSNAASVDVHTAKGRSLARRIHMRGSGWALLVPAGHRKPLNKLPPIGQRECTAGDEQPLRQ